MTDHDEDPRLILMHPALVPDFDAWLASRGLQCRNIGAAGLTEDGPEIWLVGPTDETMRRSP
jgi:hypothetical protein